MKHIDGPAALALVLLAAILLAVALSSGCAPRASRPQCSGERLAELEARYLAEVLVLCRGQEFESCEGRFELEERHAARLEEWAECR